MIESNQILKEKLLRLFDIGREIGCYEERNYSAQYSSLGLAANLAARKVLIKDCNAGDNAGD